MFSFEHSEANRERGGMGVFMSVVCRLGLDENYRSTLAYVGGLSGIENFFPRLLGIFNPSLLAY